MTERSQPKANRTRFVTTLYRNLATKRDPSRISKEGRSVAEPRKAQGVVQFSVHHAWAERATSWLLQKKRWFGHKNRPKKLVPLTSNKYDHRGRERSIFEGLGEVLACYMAITAHWGLYILGVLRARILG